jgi:lysophospholipase L1-like esterase
MKTGSSSQRAHRSGRVVAIGASMVQQGSFEHVQGLVGGRLVMVNKGTGGQRTDELNARLAADVYAQDPIYCIYDGGLNDVLQDIPQATIQANFVAARDGMRAQGIHPIFCLMQPFAGYASWSAGRETVRQNLDTFVVTQLGARWFSYAATTGTGNPPALRAEYDSGDGLHLNSAGEVAVSQAAYTQIFGGRPY